MNRNKLLIIVLTVVFSGVMAISADKKDSSVSDKNFEEFISDGNYFSILVPKGWSKDEALMTRRNMKVFGVDIVSRFQSKNVVPVIITVEYYAKDNTLYKTPEKFIKTFSKPDPTMPQWGREYGKVQPTTVAGKKAKQFERKITKFVPLYAVEQEEIPVYEKYIVVPAKEGFYVLTYRCPMSSAKSNMAIFEKIVSSFKPLKN